MIVYMIVSTSNRGIRTVMMGERYDSYWGGTEKTQVFPTLDEANAEMTRMQNIYRYDTFMVYEVNLKDPK